MRTYSLPIALISEPDEARAPKYVSKLGNWEMVLDNGDSCVVRADTTEENHEYLIASGDVQEL